MVCLVQLFCSMASRRRYSAGKVVDFISNYYDERDPDGDDGTTEEQDYISVDRSTRLVPNEYLC